MKLRKYLTEMMNKKQLDMIANIVARDEEFESFIKQLIKKHGKDVTKIRKEFEKKYSNVQAEIFKRIFAKAKE